MIQQWEPLFKEMDIKYLPELTALTELTEKVDMIMDHLGLELVDVPAKKELQKKASTKK